MAVPQLMVKIWDGDPDEYFTFMDMNRVEYNANACAKEAGVSTVAFQEVTRASQFRYDEAQKLESLLKAVAQKRGLSIDIEEAWGYNRTVSYVDFERWESNLWTIYQDLGGVGERIQSDKVLVNYHTTLFKSAWQGKGPYYIDLDLPGVHDDKEALFFVSHTAGIQARQDEYNAVLRAVPNGNRVVRVYAQARKPKSDIPLVFAIGGLQMHTEINLAASGWEGSGPWTQTVTIPDNAIVGVIGQWEGMTAEAVEQMMAGGLHVSEVSGKTATIRVIGTKPTIDLNPMLLYDVSNVE